MLLCLLALGVITAECVQVTVYNNGESEGGVRVSLDSSMRGEWRMLQELSHHQPLKVHGHPDGSRAAERVFNSQGVRIRKAADLVEGSSVYLVAPNLQFVYPFVALGHRVSVLNGSVTLESVSDRPRVFRVHGIVTEEERSAILESAYGSLAPSRVTSHAAGAFYADKTRTSAQTFVEHAGIKEKALRLNGLDCIDPRMANLQVVHYEEGQGYFEHLDQVSLGDEFNNQPSQYGTNRHSTLFMYLEAGPELRGGQTVFTRAKVPEDWPVEEVPEHSFEEGSWEHVTLPACFQGLSFKPEPLGAILFYNQRGNGELDEMALHAACPVLAGAKTGANVWVWNGPAITSSRHADINVTLCNAFKFRVQVLLNGKVRDTLWPTRCVTYVTRFFELWQARQVDSRVILWHYHAREEDMGHEVQMCEELYRVTRKAAGGVHVTFYNDFEHPVDILVSSGSADSAPVVEGTIDVGDSAAFRTFSGDVWTMQDPAAPQAVLWRQEIAPETPHLSVFEAGGDSGDAGD